MNILQLYTSCTQSRESALLVSECAAWPSPWWGGGPPSWSVKRMKKTFLWLNQFPTQQMPSPNEIWDIRIQRFFSKRNTQCTSILKRNTQCTSSQLDNSIKGTWRCQWQCFLISTWAIPISTPITFRKHPRGAGTACDQSLYSVPKIPEIKCYLMLAYSNTTAKVMQITE